MLSLRSECVFNAKLAERMERYDEMARSIKQVAELHEELTVDERNLLSCAFKSILGPRRSALRLLTSVYAKETSNEVGQKKLNTCKNFYEKVGRELTTICDEVTAMLEKDLIPHAKAPQSQVFYLKMEGDFYRYKAEALSDSVERKQATEQSLDAYKRALAVANTSLETTDPVRLGLALNFSVFYYEILCEKTLAIDLVKKTFNDAIHDIDALTETSYRDSTIILQLLRDNLTLWMAEEDASFEEDDGITEVSQMPAKTQEVGQAVEILKQIHENMATWK